MTQYAILSPLLSPAESSGGAWNGVGWPSSRADGGASAPVNKALSRDMTRRYINTMQARASPCLRACRCHTGQRQACCADANFPYLCDLSLTIVTSPTRRRGQPPPSTPNMPSEKLYMNRCLSYETEVRAGHHDYHDCHYYRRTRMLCSSSPSLQPALQELFHANYVRLMVFLCLYCSQLDSKGQCFIHTNS